MVIVRPNPLIYLHLLSFLTLYTIATMQPLTLAVAGIALVAFALISLYNRLQATSPWKNKATEPPGPWLVPWVGRIHDLPIEYMWLKFKEWGDTYGPIYRTQMLGAPFIIITDEKVAEDLLVKRAKIYSDRPEIRSLFDPKSTHGSMEYLPLMGRNGTSIDISLLNALLTEKQNTGLAKGSSRTPTLRKLRTHATMV